MKGTQIPNTIRAAKIVRRLLGVLVLLMCTSCVFDAPPPPPVERRPPVVRPPVVRPPVRRTEPTRPPPPPPDAAHLAPGKFSTIQLKQTSWALPAGLTKDKTMQVAVSGNDVWLGGASGLYRLQNGKFEEVSRDAVLAMAVWKASDSKFNLVISRGKKLEIYDRGLVDSSLNGKLGDEPVKVLFSRGTQELWIGTTATLWQLKGDKLSEFSEIKGVQSIQGHANTPDIVVTETDGSIKILREDAGAWTLRALTQDGDKAFDAVTPASQGEFWGIVSGMLYFRRRQEDQAAWWPYIVQPDAKPANPGDIPVVAAEWQISRLLLDVNKGFTWGLTPQQLLRLDGNEVVQLARPKELSTWLTASLTSDGSLWVGDGTNLVRISEELKPPSYKDDIEPFLAKSCTKCHVDGGAAGHYPLTSFEKAKAGIESMIKRIETTNEAIRMPPPPQTLSGGDAELLKRWKADGYLP